MNHTATAERQALYAAADAVNRERITLRISATIAQEWMVRCIADVIPELDGIEFCAGPLVVDGPSARAIADDCRFYADPHAVDATPGERSAYRSLLKQITSAGFGSWPRSGEGT